MRKGKKQRFARQEASRYKKLKKTSWRRADGMHSKMRRRLGGKGASPAVGYGSPARYKGLHPCGLKEVGIHNPSELDKIEDGQAVRISSRVGKRKRIELLKKIKELKLKVLNPTIGKVVIGDVDDLERFSEIKEYVRNFSFSEDVEDEEELLAKAKELGIKLEKGK